MSCEASESFELVTRCEGAKDNTNSSVNCAYSKTIGTIFSASMETAFGVSAEHAAEKKELFFEKFNDLGNSTVVSFDWRNLSQESTTDDPMTVKVIYLGHLQLKSLSYSN